MQAEFEHGFKGSKLTPQLGLTLQVQVGGHDGSELLQRLHGTAGVPGQMDKFRTRHITAN